MAVTVTVTVTVPCARSIPLFPPPPKVVRMKLSVILISYDMSREIPRTLQSLSRSYQGVPQDFEYEVLLVDNGSPTPLQSHSWAQLDVPVKLMVPQNPLPSPARAINQARREASGDVICLMIDGAHLLTPGVFLLAQKCFAAFDNPVVATRYFYLGPDEQPLSIAKGYDKQEEDALLRSIDWPSDGYRLYEVGTPLRAGAANITWFNRMFESNCLFMSASLFRQIGGAEEKFDSPGGGFLNLDIYKRAQDVADVTPVQLIGEGSFHQLHGGTTTNAAEAKRSAQQAQYMRQYQAIRGHDEVMSRKTVFYMGHMPTQASKIHQRNR